MMRMQADAILAAAARVDEASFDRAVRLVLEAPGKVVVCGAGKSDALAIRTMEERGLTAEDFAMNHPSGTLGRRLTLTVADILRVRPVRAAVAPAALWADVVKAITDGGVGAVTVEDEGQMLVGIIT